MRAAAAIASLALAACAADAVEFPGDEVEPRWVLTATGESSGESVAVLPDGSIVVLIRVNAAPRPQIALDGETYTLEDPGLLVLKLSSADGSVLAWTELYGLSGSRMIATEDGDLLVSAIGPGVEGFGDSIVRLAGDDLSVRWMRTLDLSGDISGARVTIDEAGDVIAAHTNMERLHVEKLDGADGAGLWTSEPLSTDSEATDVVALPGGDVIVVGYSHIGDRFENDLLRLSGEDGTPVWQQADVDLGGDGIGEALELTGDGDLLVASSSPLTALSFEIDTYAARMTPDGEVSWTQDICISDSCYGTWPFPILLRGTTALMTVYDGDLDITLQSFSADDGDLESPARIWSTGASEIVRGAALDEDGGLVVTGTMGQDLGSGDDDYVPGSAFVLAL